MKNKILAFLLIAVLVCALPPATVLASNGTVENVKTFKFAAGVTTQADIDASLGDGIIECTSSEVGGQTIYTIKLLKNIVMAPGHDFRVNEYNSGGMSLPPGMPGFERLHHHKPEYRAHNRRQANHHGQLGGTDGRHHLQH